MLLECDDSCPAMQAQTQTATNAVKGRLTLTAVPLLILVGACVHDRNSRPVSAEPAVNPPASTTVAAISPPQEPDARVTAPTPEPAPSQTNTATGPPPTPATQPSAGQPGPATARTGPPNTAVTPRAPATSPVPAASAAVAAASPPSRPPVAAAAPTLDLKGLEQRLRDTGAIGLFTKLSLKNQVDDLLAQFKMFHQGQSRNTLEQLRQKYEVLLMKVVTLLQDGDPALASAILSSREAIWGILTDPKRFAAI
jgi:hypothetical protein